LRINFTKSESWVLRRSFSILKREEKFKLSFMLLAQVIIGLLDLFGVILIGLLASLSINGLTAKASGSKVTQVLGYLNLGSETLQRQITVVGILAAALLTIKTLTTLYFSKKMLYFLSNKAAALTSELLGRLLNMSLIELRSKSLQEMMFALTQGVRVITVDVLGGFITLLADISLLIVLSASLFIVNPLVALISFCIFGVTAAVLFKVMHIKAYQLGNDQAQYGIESQQRIFEVVTGFREIYAKRRLGYYYSEISKLRYTLSNAIAGLAFLQNISKYIIELSLVLGSLVIAGVLFITQTASHALAVLAIFLTASTRIAPAVLRIQQSAIQIKGSTGTSQPTLDLVEFLASSEPVSPAVRKLDCTHDGFQPTIRARHLNFKYPGKEEFALKDVSFDISAGDFIAIVGPSGGGKTTLVDVILGLLNPESGEISISGQTPRNALDKWPGSVGYVPQDVFIMNATIRENIGVGYTADEYESSMIDEAIKMSQLQEMIGGLSNGVETFIDDRGTSISGGQKQRIGIARALFTNPKLLILDEATSALDGETEAAFTQAIHALKGKVTIILIAHRLSTVRNADSIIYMDSGQILGQANYEKLREHLSAFDQQAKLMGL